MTVTAAAFPAEGESLDQYIDRLLDEHRPTGLYEGTDWIVEAGIPALIARWETLNENGSVDARLERNALYRATSREGGAGRRANKAIRKWLEGQGPLDWAILGPIPVKISGTTKCRLDSITADLLEDSADFLETKLRGDYSRGLLTVDGRRLLAREFRRRDLGSLMELGDGQDIDRSRWENLPTLPGLALVEDDDAEDDEF